jgi:hypothetical protein
MKRILLPLTVLVVLLFAAAGSIPATAQDSENDNAPIVVDLEEASGSLSIQHEVETKAKVELMVGDQLYQLTVPVTVQIDATKLLADAQVSAAVSQRIGAFLFEPVKVEVLEGDYQKDFRTVSPKSPENVIVVYTANVTNLHSEPIDVSYSSDLETSAVDDAGNRYKEERRACGNIGPGEKITCEFIYDVPSTANLVDLNVSAVAYKQFTFAQTEASE